MGLPELLDARHKAVVRRTHAADQCMNDKGLVAARSAEPFTATDPSRPRPSRIAATPRSQKSAQGGAARLSPAAEPQCGIYLRPRLARHAGNRTAVRRRPTTGLLAVTPGPRP